MNEATCAIAQKRFLGGRQTLTIDGDKLTVEYKRGLSFHERRFDLQGVRPEPVRIRQSPTGAIIARILSGVLGLAWVLAAIHAKTANDTVAHVSVIGAALVAIGLGGWMPMTEQRMNAVIFQGPAGQVALWPNLPNKDTFDAFLAVLTARIREAQKREQPILRQLHQAGILDAWQYDQAMELFERDRG